MAKREVPASVREGRAKNAVAALFSRTLTVPKVFFEVSWPSQLQRVDVLAVDRAGAGEVHVAEVANGGAEARRAVRRLLATPAHFKYLVLDSTDVLYNYDKDEPDPILYDSNGYGRVGLIEATVHEHGEPLSAEIILQPERFRTPPDIYDRVDKFLERHTPDLAIRP